MNWFKIYWNFLVWRYHLQKAFHIIAKSEDPQKPLSKDHNFIKFVLKDFQHLVFAKSFDEAKFDLNDKDLIKLPKKGVLDIEFSPSITPVHIPLRVWNDPNNQQDSNQSSKMDMTYSEALLKGYILKEFVSPKPKNQH